MRHLSQPLPSRIFWNAFPDGQNPSTVCRQTCPPLPLCPALVRLVAVGGGRRLWLGVRDALGRPRPTLAIGTLPEPGPAPGERLAAGLPRRDRRQAATGHGEGRSVRCDLQPADQDPVRRHGQTPIPGGTDPARRRAAQDALGGLEQPRGRGLYGKRPAGHH